MDDNNNLVMDKDQITPSVGISLFVLLGIFAILMVGLFVIHADMHTLLLVAVFLAVICSLISGFKFDDIVEAMKDSVSKALAALLIFFMIGAITGSWLASGTVPALIYYGLQFINPTLFLPIGFVLASITSLCTGTSWGTIGTMGIALMGVGASLGVPPAIVAGMVVSGAIFGDKCSPISDTTVLASACGDAYLYDHIKSVLCTAGPAWGISFVLYLIVGLRFAGGTIDSTQINLIQDTLAANFNLNPIVLLPLLVLIILSLKKVPALVTMFFGCLTAVLIALIFQHESLGGVLSAINNGYTRSTGVDLVDALVVRGGIMGMMWVFALAFIALCLGGVLNYSGFLYVLIGGVANKVNRTGPLVALAIVSGMVTTAAMGEAYMGIILTSSLYKRIFKEKGYKPYMLSRHLEEGCTCISIVLPWVSAGAFAAATLGVNSFALLPYAFLNILTPIISIVFAFLGIAVFWENKPIKVKK